MDRANDGREVYRSTSERNAIPLRLLVEDFGLASRHLPPVLLGDGLVVLPAPLLFLVMNKHSLGACVASARLDPRAIIEAQIDLVLHGLQAPAPARPAKPSKGAKR